MRRTTTRNFDLIMSIVVKVVQQWCSNLGGWCSRMEPTLPFIPSFSVLRICIPNAGTASFMPSYAPDKDLLPLNITPMKATYPDHCIIRHRVVGTPGSVAVASEIPGYPIVRYILGWSVTPRWVFVVTQPRHLTSGENSGLCVCMATCQISDPGGSGVSRLLGSHPAS